MTPEDRAHAAAEAIKAAGFADVEVKWYRALPHDVEAGIGERTYVIVTVNGRKYSAQWHDKHPHGTGYMNNRGDGWVEATAGHLTAIADTATVE